MTLPPPAPDDEPSDLDCLTRVRAGEAAAFEPLYRRYHRDAIAIAVNLAGHDRADDLAAEAFARVLRALQGGKGPEHYFRGYLAVTIRNLHLNQARSSGRTSVLGGQADLEMLVPVPDGTDDLLTSTAVAHAFRTLPERWRLALWLSAVEGRTTEEVALAFGGSSHAASQLTHRAREALRLAFLAQHLQQPAAGECQIVIERLPRHIRGRAPASRARIEAHLDSCAGCASAASELVLVDGSLWQRRGARSRNGAA